MALGFPWRRRSSAEPVVAPASAASDVSAASAVDTRDVRVAPSGRAHGWRELAPIQRSLTPQVLTGPHTRMESALASWRNPSMVAPLGHVVDPAGPSGLIAALATPEPPHPSVTSETGPALEMAMASPAVPSAASSPVRIQRVPAGTLTSAPRVTGPLTLPAITDLPAPPPQSPAPAILEDSAPLLAPDLPRSEDVPPAPRRLGLGAPVQRVPSADPLPLATPESSRPAQSAGPATTGWDLSALPGVVRTTGVTASSTAVDRPLLAGGPPVQRSIDAEIGSPAGAVTGPDLVLGAGSAAGPGLVASADSMTSFGSATNAGAAGDAGAAGNVGRASAGPAGGTTRSGAATGGVALPMPPAVQRAVPAPSGTSTTDTAGRSSAPVTSGTLGLAPLVSQTPSPGLRSADGAFPAAATAAPPDNESIGPVIQRSPLDSTPNADTSTAPRVALLPVVSSSTYASPDPIPSLAVAGLLGERTPLAATPGPV
jgi:hypothetical protein